MVPLECTGKPPALNSHPADVVIFCAVHVGPICTERTYYDQALFFREFFFESQISTLDSSVALLIAYFLKRKYKAINVTYNNYNVSRKN